METIPKDVLLGSLESMADQVEVEQIILLSKVERSRRQIENGDFQSNDKVMKSYKNGWSNLIS